ncbi:hypothetical protein J1P26_15240 [Neobacillus sp. MM2021_6]|uniref:hypothetical protein n=1 Tax=Bacillaceae TaxID=186817 RepID=UPI00140A534C|nr:MULTISPECIES: hypothetical protein [Bacillaceae]MBO0961054.1 hypothetical protein [Neobacillus sp. MM2021_6]NHC21342.1 hypothetical protein [Bacillus sp. MM2020_4]
MSLKTALFEMKEKILKQQIGESENEFLDQLETKNNLKSGSLFVYFNYVMMFQMKKADQTSHSGVDHKKVNRKWIKPEIDFMFQYITDRQEEGGLNITELLDEVAQVLDRGYQSVNYKYYSLVKAQNKTQPGNQNAMQVTTISQSKLPVAAIDFIDEKPQELNVYQPISVQNDDLLDILSGLITNVQKLPGIHLNELLRSLFQLTNMALQNQDAVQQLESVKSEINNEKEVLQETLRKKDQQLIRERKRNDELQIEVAKLAKEIMAFNQLGDAAKIQNLKSYNQRLNYIIDGFGIVLQVGS